MQKEQIIKLLNSRKTALDGEYYLTALHGEYAGQPSGNSNNKWTWNSS